MTSTDAYERANTDWFSTCFYGVSVHWTAQSVPRSGKPVTFKQAVEAFDVAAFADAVAEMGANYLIFTATHGLQMMPCPNPVLDGILYGRTCERDLIQELADELAIRDVQLILYYNHSCNQGEDAAWEKAVGYHEADKNRFAANLCAIVAWMGRHYAHQCKAWWFDSCYSVDDRGPHNSVSTDMGDFPFPWERFTAAAKEGYAQRLVTYNAGIDQTFLYTTHQDYWAGEMTSLDHPPTGRYAENGLQWHGWTCLDDRKWVHRETDTEYTGVLYDTGKLNAFLVKCMKCMAPMTFNVGVYQDGSINEHALKQMKVLREIVQKLNP